MTLQRCWGAAALLTLAITQPATAQDSTWTAYPPLEVVRAADDANREQVLRDLEAAVHALREVGETEVAEQVVQVMERVQSKLREEDADEGENLEDLEMRLQVLRVARKAFTNAGDKEVARYLERVLHAGELQLAGTDAATLAEAMEGIDLGHVVEMLERAAELWADVGYEKATSLCTDLAQFYTQRLGGEGVPAEPEHDDLGAWDLDNLEHRLEVLRLATNVHVEAGHGETADYLRRFLHLGHLHLQGVGEEDLAHASEGLSIEGAVEGLRSGAELLEERDNGDGAYVCRALAQYYIDRDSSHAGGLEPAREHDLTQRSERLEVVQMAADAHAEANHPDRAHLLKQFLRYGRMQDEGASDEQLAEAGVGLSMEGAISAIASAGELWAEWGYAGRAHLCFQLADFYERRAAGEVEAGSHGGDEEAQRHLQDRDEGDDGGHEFPGWLERRAARVEILALSAKALAEAGDEEAADHMRRFTHLGQLQVQEASDERISQAAVGLNMETAIHQLRAAAEHLEHRGKREAAHACALLSRWYLQRDFGEEEEVQEEPIEWDTRELEQPRRAELEHRHAIELEHRHEREMQERHRRAMEAEHAARQAAAQREHREALARHMEQLHHRMARLHEQMAELQQHLEHLTRKLHDR